MNKFFTQAQHNSEFLNLIDKQFPDTFFDWKITVLFYVSIHLLKCLGAKRGVNIGDTHHEIQSSLDPKRCGNKQIFPFPEKVWIAYRRIHQYSKSSRYDGIEDEKIVIAAQKKDYEECLKHFAHLIAYMKSQDIIL